MPATAGNVRMSANNRVNSSAALQTHGIWQTVILYDLYAPNKEETDRQTAQSTDLEAENTYQSFQGLLTLVRVTNFTADETRGSYNKCVRVGHLTFQCLNFLSMKYDKDKDQEAIEAAVLSGLDKIMGKVDGRTDGDGSLEESSDSKSDDYDYDSELEKAIPNKFGKNGSGKVKSSRKKKDSSNDDEEGRKKRSRSKKRSNRKKANLESDTEEEDDDEKRRRKEKGRRRDSTER